MIELEGTIDAFTLGNCVIWIECGKPKGVTQIRVVPLEPAGEKEAIKFFGERIQMEALTISWVQCWSHKGTKLTPALSPGYKMGLNYADPYHKMIGSTKERRVRFRRTYS